MFLGKKDFGFAQV